MLNSQFADQVNAAAINFTVMHRRCRMLPEYATEEEESTAKIQRDNAFGQLQKLMQSGGIQS